jgi:hypothetical protein
MLRDGKDYTIGRAPSKFPFRLFCARCKRPTYLKAQDFNKMLHIESPGLKAPESSSSSPTSTPE